MKDFLAYRQTSLYQFKITLELVTIIFQTILDNKQQAIFSFTLFLILFVLGAIYVPYLNNTIQLLNQTFLAFNLFLSLNILLTAYSDIWNQFNLVVLVLIPFSYKVADIIHRKRIGGVINALSKKDIKNIFHQRLKLKINQQQKSEDHYLIDLYLRSLYNYIQVDYVSYLESKSSLLLEAIILQHQLNCKSPQYCFCSQIKDEKDRELRREFLNDYIERYYESELAQAKEMSYLHISYLIFLIDVQENPNKCLVKANQILYLCKNKSIYIRSLKNIIFYANNLQKEINNCKTYCDKSYIQDIDYIGIIHFDEQINQCFLKIKQFLELKKLTLKAVGQDYINLQFIYQDFTSAFQLRKEIQLNLRALIRKQIIHPQLIFLIDVYENYLSFGDSLSQLAQKLSVRVFTIGKRQKSSYQFDDKKCSVFISLTENIGTIVKVSNNFDQIVKVATNSEAIGKNINIMQPLEIAKNHDAILNNYLSKYRSAKSSLHLNPIIGIDKEGWAISYEIRVQPCQLQTYDFGLCGQINQIADNCMHISLHKNKNFQIMAVSESFYLEIFENLVDKHKIYQMKLNQFIPSLPILFEKFQQKYLIQLKLKDTEENDYKSHDKEFTTILIKPKNEEQLSILQNTQIYFSNALQFLEFEIYAIKGEISYMNSQYIQVIQLKITELIKINDMNLKNEELQNLCEYLNQNNVLLHQQLSSTQLQQQQQQQQQQSSYRQLLLLSNKQMEIDQQEKSNSLEEDIKEKIYIEKLDFYNTFETGGLLSPKLSRQRNSQIDDQIQYDQYLLENTRISQMNIQSPQSSSQVFLRQSFQFNNNSEKEQLNNMVDQTKLNYTSKIRLNYSKFRSNIQTDYSHNDSIRGKSHSLNFYIENQKAKNHFNKESKFNKQVSDPKQSDHMHRSITKTSELQQIKQKQEMLIEGSVHSSYSNSQSFRYIFLTFFTIFIILKSTLLIFDFLYRKSIIERIKQHDKLTGLLIFRLFFIAGLVGFLVASFVNFQKLDDQLVKQRNDYSNINWGSNIRTPMGEFLVDLNFRRIIQFVPQFKLEDQLQKEILQSIQKSEIERYTVYKNLIIKFVNSDKQKTDLYQMVLDEDFNYNYGTNIEDLKSFPQKFSQTLLTFYGLMYRIAYELDTDSQNEMEIGMNYLSTFDKLTLIKRDVDQKVNKDFQQNESTSILSLIIVLATTFLFSISFFVIFAYIQSKREQILNLFATLSPENLATMIFNISNCLNILEINSDKFNQQHQHKRQNTQQKLEQDQNTKNIKILQDSSILIQKKKNISQTSSLPRFKIRVCFMTTIFFLLTQTTTMANYFLINDFIKLEKANRQFIGGLIDISDYVVSINILRYPLILITLSQNYSLQKLYVQKSNENLSQKEEILQKMYSLVESLYGTKRYDQSSFDDYIHKVFQGDACQAVYENLDLLKKDGFSVQKCNSIKNGLYKQGLVKAVKFQIDLFSQRQPVFEEKDQAKFMSQIMEQERDLNSAESYYMRTYFDYIISSITEKVARITDDHYKYMITLNYVILFLSIFTFLLAIYLSFFRFFEICMQQLRQTKLLLNIFDVQSLEDNQYILTYLKIQR